MKQEISLSPRAVSIINSILSKGRKVEITLVGKRLRISSAGKSTVEYDVMIADD